MKTIQNSVFEDVRQNQAIQEMVLAQRLKAKGFPVLDKRKIRIYQREVFNVQKAPWPAKLIVRIPDKFQLVFQWVTFFVALISDVVIMCRVPIETPMVPELFVVAFILFSLFGLCEMVKEKYGRGLQVWKRSAFCSYRRRFDVPEEIMMGLVSRVIDVFPKAELYIDHLGSDPFILLSLDKDKEYIGGWNNPHLDEFC